MRAVKGVCLWLLTGMIAFLTVGYGQTTQEFVARGFETYRQGDYKATINNLLKAEVMLPKEPSERKFLVNARLGESYARLGQYQAATQHLDLALSLTKNLPSLDVKTIGYTAFYNGNSHYELGDHAKAVQFYQQSLAILEKVLPEDHLDLAATYNNLGAAYADLRNYTEAIRNHERAFTIYRKVLPEDLLGSATSYSNHGIVYLSLGNYTRAIDRFELALANYEKVLPEDHLDLAATYNNLGAAYYGLSNYTKAIRYHKQALAIYEKVLPKNHPDLATSYNNLGAAYRGLKNYAAATRYHKQALAIREEVLPESHSDLATSYNDLGVVYRGLKNYAEATRYHKQALAIREEVLPESHPDLATSYNDLGVVHFILGDYIEAFRYHEQAVKVLQTYQQTSYGALDTTGKLLFNKEQRNFYGNLLSSASALKGQRDNKSFTRSLSATLTFKGSASGMTNSLTQLAASATSQKDKALLTLLQSYNNARWRLGNLTLAFYNQVSSLGSTDDAEAYILLGKLKAILKYLETQIEVEKLERDLAAHPGTFTQVLANVTVNDLLTSLPSYSLYLDFSVLPAEGTDQLFAFAVRPNGSVNLFRLGEAEPLLASVEELRSTVSSSDNADALRPEDDAWRDLGERLYNGLLRKLLASVEGIDDVKTLVIVPDAELHFLPFDLLSDGKRLLGERFDVHYVPSGRDLIRLARTARDAGKDPEGAARLTAAIFADPSFGEERENRQNQTAPVEVGSLLVPDELEEGLRGGPADPALYQRALSQPPEKVSDVLPSFGRLEGTLKEGKQLLTLFNAQGQDAELYTATEASEENLFALQSPKILHLATHGFFLGENTLATLPNAWQRAVIALAGYERSRQAGSDDEGIVTAFKLATLNLSDTELVVLSACETGLGDAQVGEGVAGLSQALFSAGVGQVVMSLWKVKDQATASFMTRFYNLYLETGSASVALSQTKQEFRDGGYPPAVWAAFVLSGVE